MFRFLFILVIGLFLAGCNGGDDDGTGNLNFYTTGKPEKNKFSISTELLSKSAAGKTAENIRKHFQLKIYVQRVKNKGGKSGYIIEIGSFVTAYSAGKTAYKLFSRNFIKKYSITYNNKKVVDQFANFVFVGSSKGVPSLYRYDLVSEKSSVFKKFESEKVVELEYSADNSSAFFLTASDFGKQGVFPYINNVKIYHINFKDMSVEKVSEIGNGIQVFTFWETPNLFKIIMNSFMENKLDFVIDHTMGFNKNGKVIQDESKTYDIVKENFPPPPDVQLNNSSPGYDYALTSVQNKDSVLYYLDNNKNLRNTLIASSKKKLNLVSWTNDGKYVVFSTTDINPGNKTLYSDTPETSDLYVYSVEKMKIINLWKGSGYKNFILRDDLLFFDSGFGDNSVITVFNITGNKIIDEIKLEGGCGIKFIPEIPDFGV